MWSAKPVPTLRLAGSCGRRTARTCSFTPCPPGGETEVLLLQDLEGDENAYDSLSDGDLIRIGYAVIRYDDSGQGSVAPYEWDLKQEGTPEDVPAGVYAEIQARFPGRA